MSRQTEITETTYMHRGPFLFHRSILIDIPTHRVYQRPAGGLEPPPDLPAAASLETRKATATSLVTISARSFRGIGECLGTPRPGKTTRSLPNVPCSSYTGSSTLCPVPESTIQASSAPDKNSATTTTTTTPTTTDHDHNHDHDHDRDRDPDHDLAAVNQKDFATTTPTTTLTTTLTTTTTPTTTTIPTTTMTPTTTTTPTTTMTPTTTTISRTTHDDDSSGWPRPRPV
ncbi:hypothetical protein FN846DRAFT_910632 [Sphaerosporella brunnea]|uniref:Uncharacterized protein n=1 Tax=Sphaerosporella brunnea TaxID=1250544 RepID=A0A5J5EN50_9PEZI|nr:hypothetical protein FN846DRAFT_910632 [Sphaerosporella brunnea]